MCRKDNHSYDPLAKRADLHAVRATFAASGWISAVPRPPLGDDSVSAVDGHADGKVLKRGRLRN